MKKYRTRRWDCTIEVVDVIKESPRRVTLTNGRRENKSSDYSTYHDTFESAAKCLQERIDYKKNEVKKMEEELTKSNAAQIAESAA